MSNNAITVEPNIYFEHMPSETLIVDSTEHDLNRVIFRQLVSTNLKNPVVQGFYKPYYFNDESEMMAAVEMLVKDSKKTLSVDDTPFYDQVPLKSGDKQTPYCIVFGEVSVDLEQGEGHSETKTETIAHPIYRVYPNKKGEYLPYSSIQSYIKNSWMEAFHEAIMPSGLASKTASNSSLGLSNNLMLKAALIVCFLLIVLLAFYAVAKDSGGPNNAFNSAPTSYNSPELSGASSGLMAASQKSGNESYQAIYEDETKKMLEKMNINLDESNNDMGCFTQ